MVHPNAFSPPPDICDCGEDELCNLHAAAPKLLKALEALMPDMSVIVGAHRIEEGPDNVSGPERRRNEALDAIEEARKA